MTEGQVHQVFINNSIRAVGTTKETKGIVVTGELSSSLSLSLSLVVYSVYEYMTCGNCKKKKKTTKENVVTGGFKLCPFSLLFLVG